MVKAFAGAVVVLGQVGMVLALIAGTVFGAMLLARGEAMAGIIVIASGIGSAMSIAVGVFILAALLEICERLEELVKIARKHKPGAASASAGNGQTATAGGDAWLDQLGKKR